MKKISVFAIFIHIQFFLIGQQITFERIPAPSPAPSHIADFRGVVGASYDYADVDGDGDLDVMITGEDGASEVAALYINNGLGNFQIDTKNPPNFFEGAGFGTMNFSDFDGDNDLDIVITGFNYQNKPKSNLYFNDGSGVFTRANNFAVEHVGNSALDVGDIDNDGDLDIMISGQSVTYLPITKLYKNNGLGSFTVVNNTPFDFVEGGSIDFADIDGDSDLDVLMTGSIRNPGGANNRITKLYKNNGQGNFTLVNNTPFPGLNYSDAAFEDIDFDGDQDLIISGSANVNQYITNVYLNDGTGNYSLQIPNTLKPLWNSNLVFADIDNDNNNELLLTGLASSLRASLHSILYKKDSGGHFNIYCDTSFYKVYAGSSIFLDTDQDGDQDLITGGDLLSSNEITSYYINDSLGNFKLANGTPFMEVQQSSVVISDINGDNLKDVILSGRDIEDRVRSKIYTNNGAGNFIESQSTLLDLCLGSNAVSDVDGDSDNDILISGIDSIGSYFTKLYLNDGNGGFTMSTNQLEGLISSATAFADVDGDLDEDLLITGLNISRQERSNLYLNDGTGQFTLVSGTPFTAVRSGSVAFSDIDADNDMDVIISGSFIGGGFNNKDDNRSIKLYKNNGLGQFSLVPGTPFDSVHRSSIVFVDIDLDGDEDLVISGAQDINGYNSICQTYTNDGVGNFSLKPNPQLVGFSLGSISILDLNLDLYPDLLITGEHWNVERSTRLYINDRSGNFSLDSVKHFENSTRGKCVVGDLDDDGDVDVVMTGANNYRDPFSRFYRNTSCISNSVDTVELCYQYTWLQNNNTYFRSGIYYDTLQNSNLCDSLVILKLTINKEIPIDTISACNRYFWNGRQLSSSGVYYDTTAAPSGCDSISRLDLTINHPSSSFLSPIVCDSFIAPSGLIITQSGTYLDTIVSSTGCDSVITINVKINNSNHIIDTITECNEYTWSQNGVRYTTSGFYSDSLLNKYLCDSIISLDLTIKNNTDSTFYINACNSYITPSGKRVESTGTYLDTIINSVGCDSLITINLQVNNSDSFIDTVEACNEYTWAQNGVTYSSSGFYSDSLLNRYMCDSIVSLDLTLNQSPRSNNTITSCEAYTWRRNGLTYTMSGIYSDTVPSQQKCDSIVSINLTIDPINTSITQNNFTLISNDTNSTYQWLDCNDNYSPLLDETNQIFSASTRGLFAVEISKLQCIDTSFCIPVPEINFQERNCIVVFPNPTMGEIAIMINPISFNPDENVSIYNFTGEVILEVKPKSSYQVLDLKQFSSGVYIVKYKGCKERIVLNK